MKRLDVLRAQMRQLAHDVGLHPISGVISTDTPIRPQLLPPDEAAYLVAQVERTERELACHYAGHRPGITKTWWCGPKVRLCPDCAGRLPDLETA